QWALYEEKRGSEWLKRLPSCPCDIGSPPKKPPLFLWLDVEPADQKYHPGATWCIRSIPGEIYAPGQQCCYDNQGKLITHGEAAGTPDVVAPYLWGSGTGTPISPILHYWQDVRSFEMCKSAGMLDIYLKYRPPNNGCNCKENP